MYRNNPPSFYQILFSEDKPVAMRPPLIADVAEHKCIHCPELFIFKEKRALTPPEKVILRKHGGLSHRRPRNTVISDPLKMKPYSMHLFNLCCAAFGVGDWPNFRKVITDEKDTDAYFEWIAHISLGTADLTHYWGLKVWPPQVKEDNARAMVKVMIRDSGFDWPDKDDVLRQLFYDPNEVLCWSLPRDVT